MKVILQERVDNLGNVGDQVNVKAGHGRNYLIPQGKALIANADNIAAFEKNRAALEKKAAEVLAAAKARGEKLEALNVKIAAMAGDEGKLFGSIGPRDISEAVEKMGVHLEKSEVRLPEGPIRMTGEYEIACHIHSEVHTKIKLVVEAEK